MHPSHFARSVPDKVCAMFAADGTALTYGELESRANQGARLLRDAGLRGGDAVVYAIENDAHFLVVSLAAQRIGVYFTPCSTRSTAQEIAYLVQDSGAKVVVLGGALQAQADELSRLLDPQVRRLQCGNAAPGWDDWDRLAQALPVAALDDPQCGEVLLYSSGTTGKPKGIMRPLSDRAFDAIDPRTESLMSAFSERTVFLMPCPLYHSAPFRMASAVLACGGTLVVCGRFDARESLRLIEAHRCTASLWVPTMFARMLQLPPEVRKGADVSSMQLAIHGAAPCSVEVKQAMIDWWGPVLLENYSGTEGIGACVITSEEWLRHKGSVGRSTNAPIHILDDSFVELPVGEVGNVYFAGTGNFSYHGDSEKTDRATSPQGWRTFGDMGYVDTEGYLYLTDRKAFMIISGGVNVYPQEVENTLSAHPKVADCAVFGVPDADLGEKVVAVVQTWDPRDAGEALGRELGAWCRERISAVKCPKLIAFEAQLPREPNGKLYKKALQQRYAEVAGGPSSQTPGSKAAR